jgi:hypothetical protein
MIIHSYGTLSPAKPNELDFDPADSFRK